MMRSSTLFLLGCAAAAKPAAHRLSSATVVDQEADKLIVRDHHRHLSTYADGGLDQACWYNKAFVTCAAAPPKPKPTSPPIATTITVAAIATITAVAATTTTTTAATAATITTTTAAATGARTTSAARS